MKKKFIMDEIAEWIETVKYESIPQSVIDRAKAQILNTISASFAGLFAKGTDALLRTAKKVFSQDGRATIFATGEKSSPFYALFVNSSLSMSFDYDDYLFLGHTGHSSVFTPLALGEELKASGKEILTSMVIANELAGRLGATVVLGPHNGQLWSFIHSLGSASSAARLLKLKREQIKNAIGIAFYQPNFPLYPGFMGPDSKMLTASIPAVQGLLSAFLAERGFTGAHSIFEHTRGFFNFFSFEPLYFMFEGLGESWVTETIAYKIYPGCAYIDTTMDALFKALSQIENVRGRRVNPHEIDEIIVEASLLTVGMDTISREFLNPEKIEAININFSIPYNVATGIIAHELTPAQLREEWLLKNAEQIRELAGKVKLIHKPEMTLKVIKPFIESGLTSKAIMELGIGKLISVRKKFLGYVGRNTELKLFEILPFLLPLTKSLLRRKRGTLTRISEIKLAFPARVTLRLQDGSEFYSTQEYPLGSSMDREQLKRVEKKFFDESHRAGIKNSDELYTLISKMEDKENVTFP